MTSLLNPSGQLFLDLDPSLQAKSWQASRNHHRGPAAWRAYLNQLCLYGVLPWLQDEFGVNSEQFDDRNRRSIWDLVGGSAVSVHGAAADTADSQAARLVLVPSEAIDVSELRVPQEWVDIPSWIGDYYVGVQINPDDRQLCLWSYTTHADLKQHGRYDSGDRTYSLPGERLADLSVLSASRSLCPKERTRLTVPPLSGLPSPQAESLIQRLGRSDCPIPRLEVPVPLWGALLEHPTWRSRLYNARQKVQDELQGQSQELSLTDLGQWLRSLAQTRPEIDRSNQGWQTLQSLLPMSDAAMAFRKLEPARIVCRGKRLTLEADTDSVPVILLVSVELEADGRSAVRVQLRPEVEAALPKGVEISLLAPSKKVVQTVQSRGMGDYIQLKRFRLPPRCAFSVQVQLGTTTILEPFTT